MPQYESAASRTTSSSASTSTLSLGLTVETPSGDWWILGRNYDVVWYEEHSSLYYIEPGVWVLHEWTGDRHELISQDGSHRQYRLGGLARQVEPQQAVKWLIRFHYEVPDQLRDVAEQVRNARAVAAPCSIASGQISTAHADVNDVPWPAYMSAKDLAARLCLPEEATRKKLERLAANCDCRIPVDSPRHGEPRFMYHVETVRDKLS